MLDAIKPLLDSGLINEDISRELNEAWQSRLDEARETLKTELREEFAQRYEHDKSVMVEALDRMVTEGIANEIQQLQKEKSAIVEDRVKFQNKLKESSTKFNDFMVKKLAEEIGELRRDRQMHNEGLEKLEKFIVHQLAREITEFAQDKRDLVETKVRLVSEAKSKLQQLGTQFVKRAAAKMDESVSQHLKSELSQLYEDIKVAKENNFGRRIFEAYAAEFGATYLNEKAEMRKLHNIIAAKAQQLEEATKINQKIKTLVESRERELRVLKENTERSQILDGLLTPLNREKQEVMRNLLENVQTPRLKSAFEKYLPAVLNDQNKITKTVISESVTAVTGDKSAHNNDQDHSDSRHNVIEIKRLAGL
jgi:hypothetical protein